jgi:precorrin isomerase
MSWTDFSPNLLNKLIQFEKQGTQIAVDIEMIYSVANQLRLTDYKGTEP